MVRNMEFIVYIINAEINNIESRIHYDKEDAIRVKILKERISLIEQGKPCPLSSVILDEELKENQ